MEYAWISYHINMRFAMEKTTIPVKIAGFLQFSAKKQKKSCHESRNARKQRERFDRKAMQQYVGVVTAPPHGRMPDAWPLPEEPVFIRSPLQGFSRQNPEPALAVSRRRNGMDSVRKTSRISMLHGQNFHKISSRKTAFVFLRFRFEPDRSLAAQPGQISPKPAFCIPDPGCARAKHVLFQQFPLFAH